MSWLHAYVAVPFVFFSSLVFIIAYSCARPWWRNPIGISLVALDGSLALIILPHMISVWFGVSDQTGPLLVLEVIAHAAAGIAILRRTWIMCSLSGWKFRWPWIVARNGTIPPQGDRWKYGEKENL